ncbi:MAG: hypothetical protein LUG50_05895 [Planctomycetaceae bacterium]|nr:hypothetical protein [Planctomycetaceae bacterium]
MAIVKYKNQSGTTYAYESISVWDPEKKQARPKRKYLGRVDPETGEIIPTNGRGRKRKKAAEPADDTAQDSAADYAAQLEEKETRIAELEEENRQLKESRDALLNDLTDILGRYTQPTE